jgi:hypothetical protein
MLLSSYFDKFVSNIEPSEERVKVVADAHQKLREHLLEAETATFPIVDSFLAGSYARHTAHDPIKDVDIITVLKQTELSADRKQPPPTKVLNDLKKTIDEFYDKVDLRTQRRSIRVSLDEDDICMDVVPAIAPDGKDKLLWVPDRGQALWLQSHPAEHAAFATRVNDAMGGYFVRIAKATKWWKHIKLPKKRAPKSFLLETILARHATKKDTLVESFIATVSVVVTAYKPYKAAGILPAVIDPGVPTNDLVVTCGWSLADFGFFVDQLEGVLNTANAAVAAPTKEKTIELWRSVFGDAYPESLEGSGARLEDSGTRIDKAEAPRLYRYNARISAQIAAPNSDSYTEAYPSNGRKLPKHWSLKFRLDQTNVPEPYTIKWTVHNHGAEARQAGQLYHETVGATSHIETTLYRGHHFLDCEVLKDDRVVAKARHIVNVR